MFYRGGEVAEAIEVPYRTLMRLVERGLFRPEGYRARRGAPVVFTKKDVRELAIWAGLRSFFSAQQVRGFVEQLRERGHNPFSEGDFLVFESQASGSRRRSVVKVVKEKSLRLERDAGVQLMLIMDAKPLLNVTRLAEERLAVLDAAVSEGEGGHFPRSP